MRTEQIYNVLKKYDNIKNEERNTTGLHPWFKGKSNSCAG